MKKRFLCLVAALFVVCSCVVPAGAFSPKLTLAGFPDKAKLAEINSFEYIRAILCRFGENELYLSLFVSNKPFFISGDLLKSADVSYNYEWHIKNKNPNVVGTVRVSKVLPPSGGVQLDSSNITHHYMSSNLHIEGYPSKYEDISALNSLDLGMGGGTVENNPPWVGNTTTCKILSPSDGFKQQGVKLFTTRVYFCVPYDGNKNNLKYAVKGFDPKTSTAKTLDLNVIENGTKIEGILLVEGIVKQWNTEQTIYAEVTDHTGKIWRSTDCKVTAYEDFLDEDGDGLDDRTNQEEWTGGSGDPTDPRPDDGNEGFNDLPSMLKGIAASVSGFLAFLKEFFAFIPAPIFAIMTVGIGLIVILRIAGR